MVLLLMKMWWRAWLSALSNAEMTIQTMTRRRTSAGGADAG
jgi:hypothetical protein